MPVSLPVLTSAGGTAAPVRSASRQIDRSFDLLAIPGIGHLLRDRRVRLMLRGLMLLTAALIVLDGLLGPKASPMNLAGVVPWIHWRGLVVIGLLVGANFFCMVCPFTLPRTMGRKLLPRGRAWPHWLRSKWLAVGLVVAYLAAYEVLGLWASPLWTAWIIIGYFVAAFAIDGIFRGASFCKYVCPIGQFHFVSSTISPLQVKVRDAGICTSCTTHDCIRGNDRVDGCPTNLFQPKKVGNLDCTFCLDCVSACPHDNIGLMASMPGTDLLHDRTRSSIGRLSQRVDITALIAVLVFGAFANAAGMVGPVVAWIDRLADAAGLAQHRWLVVLGLLIGALLVVPAATVCAAAAWGRRWSRVPVPWDQIACRFTPTLIPIGFAMWFVHMVFHLVTSAGTIAPVVQRGLMDIGVTWLGDPIWFMSCCALSPSWLVPLEIVVLGAGMLGSIVICWQVSLHVAGRAGSALRLATPWAIVAALLYLAGIWIIYQPMEMRGMMLP
ncbi:MAG: FesM [Halioglobus sp.]|nr:FesM [Halioglobus sp.]